MNSTIEFVVKMKDMMGSSLNRLSSTSQAAFTRMTTSANNMTTRNQVLGLSFNELQNKIRQVESTIRSSTIPSQIASARRELALLQRQSSNHSGNIGGLGSAGSNSGIGIGGMAVGTMMGGFAMQAGSAIVGAIGSGVSGMLSKSAEKEQAITGLTTFLGKQGATEAYGNIRKDADVTPFDTATLLGANRALISAGIDAKTSRNDVMNLANAVSATSDGKNMPDVMARMAQNMQQIKNNKVATGMDIRQFGFAGINIDALLKKSGQNPEGKITYEMLTKALAMAREKGGIYEGALEAQGQTRAGKFSTVKDKFDNALSDIGDAFAPVTNKLLDLALKFAESIGPGLERAKPYIDFISQGVGTTVDFVMEIVNGTSSWSGWIEIIRNHFSGMWKIVSAIAIKLFSFVGSIIEFVKNSEILKDIFKFISNQLQFVGKIISLIFDGIIWVWENQIKPMLDALEWAYRKIKGIFVKDEGMEVGVKINGADDLNNLFAPKTVNANWGTPNDNSRLTTGKTLASENATAGKKAGDTVTGGGPRTINISVGKFFDNLQFTTLNNGETAQVTENLIMECLGRAIYNGAKLA